MRRFHPRALWQRVRERPYAWLLLLSALLSFVALFDPKLPLRTDTVRALVVIDITQSMGVEDVLWEGQKLSRLDAAKRATEDLLQSLPCGSEIGIGLFNEYRTFVLLAPVEVCENYRELTTTLDALNNRMSWAGASEIAKGINSGFQSVKALAKSPALIFMTDGQESPPISFLHRPKITITPGEIKGLLVGVGAYTRSPIPKYDPDGHRIGFWKPDEVAQVDIYSQGRESSVPGEHYVEDPNDPKPQAAKPLPPEKMEHLSAVREEYLALIAKETGLGYMHLTGPHQVLEALGQARATLNEVRWIDGRAFLAGLTFVLLLLSHVGASAVSGPLKRLRSRLTRAITRS
jgi:mxaL protein